MTDDIQAIRAVIDGRNAAIRRGDAEAAVAASAPNVVVYDLQPPLAFVGDEARDPAALRRWMDGWDVIPEIVLHNPAILVDGDLAVAHGFSSMAGAGEGEAAPDFWYRATIALRRGDGGWRIVHEHHSVPFLMDGSFKAAVDLKP